MPSSNKTKKKPQDRKSKTSNYGSSWKTPLHDLELPSGEICQVKRPGVQGLIKRGVLHSLDSLTAIVNTETIPKAEGKPLPKDANVEELVKDPAKFDKMMETVDKIVTFVVTNPKVVTNLTAELDEDDQPIMKDGEPVLRELTDQEKLEAKDDWDAEHPDLPLVYVDWIDAMDKMFIMNFAVGGSADLAEFRAQTEVSVGGVQPLEAAAPASE